MVLRLPDFWSNWNLELLVFEEGRKPEYRRKPSRGKGENQQAKRARWRESYFLIGYPRGQRTSYFSLSLSALVLALHARSRARPSPLADVFEKNEKKKNNVFVQASKGPHLARSGLIKEKFSFLGLFWLSNKSFINQDCSVKLAGYWTCYFFSFLWIVEPRYNEGSSDWQNLFAIKRFRYMEILFRMFYCYWGKENRSLYRGLRYIEVRYIMVSLKLDDRAIYGLPHTWSITHISHV